MTKTFASVPPRSDAADLHDLVVRFAAVSAWLVALSLIGVAITTGNQDTLIQAAAAGTAGLVFTAQIFIGRTNALFTLVFGIGMVLITYPVIRGMEMSLAASIAIVTMAIVASVFVTSYHVLFLAAGAVFALTVPLLWTDTASDGVGSGIIMAFSFLIGSSAVILVRRKTRDADQQFRWLFERAPVGLVQQDWNEALAVIEDLAPRDLEHLRDLLVEDERRLCQIVGRVRVVRANEAAADVLKVSLDDLLGYMSPDRVEDTNRDMWLRQALGMWTGRPFDVIEYEATDYQGNPGLWIEVRTISVGAPRPGHVLLAVTDVTQARQRNRDLADLVEEKDEFIATVSHELRTPLTAVVGLANEVLAADDMEEREKDELLRLVVGQANEISHLVEDLLVGARAEIGTVSIHPSAIDLGEEVETVLSATEDDIAVDVAEGTPLAYADPVRVRQIIRNLVVNAQRYGGNRRRIVVGPHPDGEELVVEVRDDGPALPPNDRERIFRPYTRAHDRPGVTVSVGLGLSVSLRLALLMGGDLVYDHDGDESIFRLRLPLA